MSDRFAVPDSIGHCDRCGIDCQDCHDDQKAYDIAKAFHVVYESLAPTYGWKSQVSTRVTFEDLPEANQRLMIATCQALLVARVIK